MIEKPNTDEHNCIKVGLITDLIGYYMHEKQDKNIKELIKYLCTDYLQSLYPSLLNHFYILFTI